MDIVTGTHPVRHFVYDQFVSPRADWTVPPADAGPGVWECVYDNELERGKRTTRSVAGWPCDVLAKMHDLDVLRACSRLFGFIAHPDALLWGGGLHVLAVGGHLATHLDGNLHPKRLAFRRAVQLVCFCNREWRPEWGGQLYFASPGGDVLASIDPLPGRLVAFEQTDLAYHGVAPVTGPAERVSVATSLLAESRGTDTRTKALFMPQRLARYASPPDTPL